MRWGTLRVWGGDGVFLSEYCLPSLLLTSWERGGKDLASLPTRTWKKREHGPLFFNSLAARCLLRPLRRASPLPAREHAAAQEMSEGGLAGAQSAFWTDRAGRFLLAMVLTGRRIKTPKKI